MTWRRAAIAVVGLLLVGIAFVVVQLHGYLTARGDDTWVLTESRGWAENSSAGPTPSMRTQGAMAYSPALKRLILFGGRPVGSECCSDETWTFGGGTWTRQTASTHPPGRAAGAMALYPTQGVVVLFGGDSSQHLELDDTWTFSETGWRPIVTAHHPPAREGAGLAFDKTSGRMILFGGSPNVTEGSPSPTLPLLADTWAFDGADWTQLSSVIFPAPRSQATFSADPTGGVLLFGGLSGSNGLGAGVGSLDDTWRWRDGTWTRLYTSGPMPPGRWSAASASSSSSVVVFGGQLGCGSDHSSRGCSTNPYLGDTWLWNGHAWREATGAPFISSQPRPRVGAGLGFDPAHGVFVLFGGPDPHSLNLV